MNIFGLPDEPYEYEFMVVTLRKDGDYDFHSNHETAVAYEVAKDIGGYAIHNLRIAGKKLKSSFLNSHQKGKNDYE